MSYIIGIDPGLTGAIALYEPIIEILHTFEMPVIAAGTKSKRIIDALELSRMVDSWCKRFTIKKVVIERVHAMPSQGVTSVFSFGMGYGVVLGILAANTLPVEMVTPQSWKKDLKVPALKDGSRARASEIFPQHSGQWNKAKWDGRAEAAMIAYYGAKHLI